MAYNFLAVERDQLYLMSPSVTDWLEEDGGVPVLVEKLPGAGSGIDVTRRL